MDTNTDEILNRNYDFPIKLASKYKQGEKVIFTREVQYGFVVSAGTEATVLKVKPEAGSIQVLINSLGKTVDASQDSIDSLETGKGNSFRNQGEWRQCRRATDGSGWLVGAQTEFIRARLDDNKLVEAQGANIIKMWDTVTGLKLKEDIIPANKIQNMIYRKYIGPIDELIEIWRKEGCFISKTGAKNQRVMELGEQFYNRGRLEFMQSAWRSIHERLGATAANQLNYAWTGIGDWMP